jgi:Zn-dependent peptidase ImmA (M78 family)/transcriptional regulator with XRE-family HTH domain
VVDALFSDAEAANPDLLVAAREALGMTQAQLAVRLSELAGPGQRISQGYVSRVEKGVLTVSGDRLTLFAAALICTRDLLLSDARLWSLGDGCLYHRNRASTKASTLRKLHAQINLLRLHVQRLAGVAGQPLPQFAWTPVVTGAMDGPADVARAVRDKYGVMTGPVRSVTRIAEDMGALVVTLPLGVREVDATSLHPPGEPPLFVINSDAPADRQRFTLGHELGHVACLPGDGVDAEEMAQVFAAELLAPAPLVDADLRAAAITPTRLLQLKAKWLISAAALLRRAYDLAVISESSYRKISSQTSALGWRTSEPDPLPAERPSVVPGMVKSAIKAAGGIPAAAIAAGVTVQVIHELVNLPDQDHQGEASL